MRLVFIYATLAIIAMVAPHCSATTFDPATPRVQQLWVKHAKPVEAKDVTSFHLYWALNDARATAARCHERGPAGSAAVLKCKTDALGPSPSELRATQEWLKPLLGSCTFEWNAVYCRAVPVLAAEAAFSLPLGQMAAWCKANNKDAPACEARYIFTTATLTVPTECGIETVSGLHHVDYVMKSAKHMGQLRKPAAKLSQLAKDAGNPPPSPYPFTPNLEGNFGDYTSALPLVLGADELAVTFIPKCQKGSYLVYSNSLAFAKTCASADDVAPVSAFATFTTVDGSYQRFTTQTYALANIYNTTAAYLLSLDYQVGSSSASSSQGHVDPSFASVYASTVFFLPAPTASQLSAFSTWGRIAVTVTVTYPNGNSATDAMVAFFDGVDYFAPSSAPDASVITARPGIYTINPNPNYVQPADLRAAYSVPTGASAFKQVSGVVEFSSSDPGEGGRGLQTQDIDWYLGNLSVTGGSYKIIGNSTIVSRGETTLDIELMMGLATGGLAYVYCLSYGVMDPTYKFYTDAMEGFASTAFGQGTAASLFAGGLSTVWSVSYGGPEWSVGETVPQADPQMLRVNVLFKHLTDAGITVTASSGDSGSFFLEGGASFGPNFPASSPYVVGVGASAHIGQGLMASNARDGNIITSGGGYSAFFAMPTWQNLTLPGTNTTRGVPDVSALGAWIYTILDGSVQPLFGTSASSPIVASLITILNRQVAVHNATKGTLRQATNFLYQQRKLWYTDVTQGDNCAGEHSSSALSNNYAIYAREVVPPTCFSAAVGWDAVTGLGEPQLSTMLETAYTWNPQSQVDPASGPTPKPGSTPGPKAPEGSSDQHLLIGVGVAVALGALGIGFCVYKKYGGRGSRQDSWSVQSGQPQNAQAIYASMPSNYKPSQNTAYTTDYV